MVQSPSYCSVYQPCRAGLSTSSPLSNNSGNSGNSGNSQSPDIKVVDSSTIDNNQPIPGAYIVILKDDAKDSNVEDAAKEVGQGNGRIKQKYTGAIRGVAFNFPEQADDRARQNVLSKIKSRADVKYISPDYAVSIVGAAGMCQA